MRPTINIPKKSVLDLDGFFGLHPAMASFEAALEAETSRHRARRRIARSHALALRCAGLYGVRHTRDESHRRRMAQPRAHEDAASEPKVSISRHRPRTSLPRILSGKEPAVAVNNLNDFSVGGKAPMPRPTQTPLKPCTTTR